MLWKNNGLILTELLLSLSCLLMLGLFFIPLIIDLTNQTKSLYIEKQAFQLLYEELQTSVITPLSSKDHTVTINGVEYQITLREIAETGQKEMCVKVEGNDYYVQKNICRTTE